MRTITVKRTEVIDLPNSKESKTTYKDIDTGNSIEFISTPTPWTWNVKTECPVLKKATRKLLNKYVENAVNQHDYKGGFNEATEILTIKIKA